MRVRKESIAIGSITVSGYLCDKGRFWMSLSDICGIAGWGVNRTSHIFKNKYVKTLALKGSDSYFILKNEGGKTVHLVSIDWVPSVLQGLARSGAEEAWVFLDALAGVALLDLFSASFGVALDREQQQAYLAKRLQGIEKRNGFTEAISAFCDRLQKSEEYRRFIYSRVSDRLNVLLTGHKAAHWCELLDCQRGSLRDNWSTRHLQTIDEVERYATVLVGKGEDPVAAIEQAVAFFEHGINANPVRTVSVAAERMRKKRAKV